MSDVTLASRYTRALFELAEKEDRIAEIDAGLHAVAGVLEAQPKVLLLMANPTLTTPEKCRLALKLLGEAPPELLERFFRVLIDKKRFALLPQIQKMFHDLSEKRQGVQEVEMISAVSLSSGFLEKLKAVLAKKLCATIRLLPKTDRNILGGFVLRFAGKEVDCSFKNRLHEIQQKLTANIGPSF
jgi:F-type H+-transporting ATPase subunit delta